MLFLGAGGLALCLLAGGGLWLHEKYSRRVHPESSFWEIPISASKADVKFLKGESSRKSTNANGDWWEYRLAGYRDGEHVYNVEFRKDQIRAIIYGYEGRSENAIHPYLQEITYGSNYRTIIDRLGQPSHTSSSGDDLVRILSFKKYNLFFVLEKNAVIYYGVYNPIFGEMKVSDEKDPSNTKPGGGKAKQ